jgi:hypothetical protein
MAGQRLAGSGASAPVTVAGVGGPATSRGSGRQAGRTTARVGGSVARGVGGFLRPFGRVGRKILLEVTGVFFLLFVLIFGNWAWKLHADYLRGPEHVRFLVYAGMMLVFLYLTVSSFWRARRK